MRRFLLLSAQALVLSIQAPAASPQDADRLTEPQEKRFNDTHPPKLVMDLVFMAWVFHHVDQPVPLLKSLLPSLKPWGSVVMVEPVPAQTEPGARALTRELLGREAREAGFELGGFIEGRLKEDNIIIFRPAVPDSPDSRERRKVQALWLEFLGWAKASPAGPSLRGYAESLDKRGMDIGEIRRCLQVLRGQYTEQPEGIEMTYDPLYGKPLTGELGKDGFKTAPNVFLVESMKSIGPGGKALDVGAGMGRNGVYLAKLGWEVTGIDLSAQGLAVMKAGLKVETIKTSYEDYDFGKERWDLLAMILSWAPIEDPALLARLKASIKPGGYVVFEHVTQREKDPFPPGVHAPAPGALRESCSRTSRSSSTGSSTTTATGAGRQPATSAWSPASAAERPEVHSLIGGRLPGIGPEAGPNPTFSLEGEPGFM